MNNSKTKYSIANVSSKLVSNDEFYTPIEPIKELIDLIKIPKETIIWCPFDLDDSNFVKVFKNEGYKVINTHIQTGQDFLTFIPDFDFDYIISNPPFKNKKLFIEKAKSYNKKWILLFGSSITFRNGMANILNECNKYFIYKPITFISQNLEKKKFLCLWLGDFRFDKKGD